MARAKSPSSPHISRDNIVLFYISIVVALVAALLVSWPFRNRPFEVRDRMERQLQEQQHQRDCEYNPTDPRCADYRVQLAKKKVVR